MPDLGLPDATLHYEIDGSGPPLIMLAGMLSDSASWGPAVPLLAEHFTCIRPDNRLTGRTTTKTPVTLHTYVEDTLALLDHLGHDRAHVLGHSMGGMVAMDVAHKAPGRVASLTTAGIAPAAFPRSAAWFDTLMRLRDDAPDGLWLRALLCWLFASGFYRDAGALDDAVRVGLAYEHLQSAEDMRAQIAALTAYRPGFKPDELAVPFHAILGCEDMLIPLDRCRAALSRLPKATITEIALAGHSIHWDQPQAFADAVTTYIRQSPT